MKKEDELLKELTDMVKETRGRLSGSFPARLQSTMMRP